MCIKQFHVARFGNLELVSVIKADCCFSSFLNSVNQTSLHSSGPPNPSHSYRNASGISTGRPEDHGGHRWLAQTLQISKCEWEPLQK